MDDDKSQIAGPSNGGRGIPTPLKDLKIEIEDDDANVSKSGICDQSIHDINDVASHYTAYTKNQQNAQHGQQVSKWKQKIETRKLQQNNKPMMWPDTSEHDVSMDDMGGRPSLLASGLAASEIKPAKGGLNYQPPQNLKGRQNSLNSQENTS